MLVVVRAMLIRIILEILLQYSKRKKCKIVLSFCIQTFQCHQQPVCISYDCIDDYEYNLPKPEDRIFRVLHRDNPNEQLILTTPTRLKCLQCTIMFDDFLSKTYCFVYLLHLLNQRRLEKQY